MSWVLFVCKGDLLLPISLTGWSQKLFTSLMHLISLLYCHHWSFALMLPLSIHLLQLLILFVARRSLVIVCLVLKTGGAVLDSLLLYMNFVLWLATLASIDMVFASILIKAICGIPYLIQFFLPFTICLPLNVGCKDTLKALTEFFHFRIF